MMMAMVISIIISNNSLDIAVGGFLEEFLMARAIVIGSSKTSFASAIIIGIVIADDSLAVVVWSFKKVLGGAVIVGGNKNVSQGRWAA